MAKDQAPIAAETARRRWVVLALLILVNTLSMADRNIMLAAQEAIKHQFRLTDTQVGSLTGLVFGLTYAIASVPMGMVADRTDKGRLLAAAQVVWSGATALAAAAWGYASLFGLRFLVGLSEATCVPTGLALIADHFPQKERAGAFSLFNLGVPIGTGASLALGALIIARWGWRTGLLIAGLPGLLVAVLIFLVVRSPPRPAASHQAAEPWFARLSATLRTALSLPSQRLLLIGTPLISAALAGILAWALPFLMRIHHVPLAKAGPIVGLAMALGVFGLGGIGALFQKLKPRDPRFVIYFAIGIAVIDTIGALLLALSPNVWGSIAGLAILGCVGYGYSGPLWALSLNLAHEGERGVLAAVMQVLITLLGYGVGTFALGGLSDLYGGPTSLRWATLTLASLFVAAIVLFLGIPGRIQADLERINGGAPNW